MYNFSILPDYKLEDYIFPEKEYRRAQLMNELREKYRSICRTNFNIDPPSGSFSRWLFFQLSINKAIFDDPILKNPYDVKVLEKQILENLPISTYIPWKYRKNLRYIRNIIDKWFQEMENHKIKLPSDEYERLLSINNPEALIQEFNKIRNSSSRLIEDVFSSKVSSSLEELIQQSVSIVKELQRVPITGSSYISLANLTSSGANSRHWVKYKDKKISINHEHYTKLEKLWSLTLGHKITSRFPVDLWNLLCRYSILFPTDRFEGSAFHSSAPERVIQVLNEELGVTHECFASPFNCYLRSYCSAFPDVDRPFGSKGSFFDFRPISGSFEVGPPYTEEVIERTASHIQDLLENSERIGTEISFIVFVPDWRDPLQPGQKILESSRFLRKDFVLKGDEHYYIVGQQHVAETERYFRAPFDTHVYILQSKEGNRKWPVKKEVIDRIREAFKDLTCSDQRL